MEIFNVKNLSFTYPSRTDKALDNISFCVKKGEFVVLCGKSGCGKTTLMRLLKPSLSPFGKTDGSIRFEDKLIEDCAERLQAASIGFVMQNPDNQIVTDKVWHEIAFGLESLGYKQNVIRTKVSEMVSFFGLQSWFDKKISELSGGQKQLLNLASAMVLNPSVLLLDEPTSQLDPIAAGEFLNMLGKINRELGVTVILSEHHLEDCFPLADRVIVMDDGKIIADQTPQEVGRILWETNHDMYLSLPTPMRVHCEVKNILPCPLTVRDGRNWLESYSKTNTLNPALILNDNPEDKDAPAAIEFKDVWFRYERALPDVIKGLNMSVKKGEFFCILGGNAVGKTTALSLVAGLNTPYRGNVYIDGQSISKISNLYNGLLGFLPQNPQIMFAKNTVYLDLMEVLEEKKIPIEEKEDKIKNIAMLCRIEKLLSSHPYDLSGGEQQRAALAKVLLTQPRILLLDEATKGMDASFKEEFADIITQLKISGITVVMVSHDIEFCAKYADRCALFFDGNITSVGKAKEFFKGNNFYTTSANRMARTCLPDAVLAEDIILACGGKIKKRQKNKRNDSFDSNGWEHEESKIDNRKEKDSQIPLKTLWKAFSILLLIPLTLYIGASFLGNRKYYLTSILIIIEAMIPFFMMFEWRKPKSRDIVIISVLCAIAVAGRAVFFSFPQFKPVVALVIISAVCFGSETGFLVGAVTGFVSNFFFGQGPWTPWQMFAFGIIGFVAGNFFKIRFIKKNRLTLCVFGFFATLIIYGGIMNPASIITMSVKPTLKVLFGAFAVALPIDLIHSVATVIFLWFISEPMIEKLERVKIKYGIISKN